MDSALNPAPVDVPRLLRAHGLTPRKGLGQNFLVDSSALRKLVEAAEIPPDAEVLEIGAGVGSLTVWLAAAARRVVAVEVDANLIPLLRQSLSGLSNVTLVEGDILAVRLSEWLQEEGYLVVANIPYYITSAIIRHLLESRPRPARMVLTMQREVAERICAAPGEMSLLALSVQVFGQPRPVLRIPAGAFYPPPQVDSVSLRVDLYPQPLIPADLLNDFFRLAKAGFAQKRKTLRNSLSAGLAIPPAQAAASVRSRRH
ncbi:MAG: ribosomal RNA small subunit methyltransferase A [Bellilinea sp.]|nr:MAG: ribosomal RNA small subunit methyltransferase A [Bellilinea sp.]